MEEITHGVHEHSSRGAPAQRLVQLFRNQSQIEALLVWVSLYTTEAFGESLRVAVFATGTNLRATPHWIPRRIGPLDCGSLSQLERPFSPVFIEDVHDDVLCSLRLSGEEQIIEYRVC